MRKDSHRNTFQHCEPSSTLREMAHYIATFMNAYMQAGFTREEAFEIILWHLSSSESSRGQ